MWSSGMLLPRNNSAASSAYFPNLYHKFVEYFTHFSIMTRPARKQDVIGISASDGLLNPLIFTG